ncbi:MAG TPA: TRAP transporter TatT component family protein [Anaeromyxobacteraceae bacterium]|nr:TRAP transporter TatT component family protein [Anaeromyxobacteraceae bacterium]
MNRHLIALPALAALLFAAGCKTVAVGFVADAIAGGGGGAMASDDDPELVRDAVPFALKSMEGLLEEDPRHEGLLRALASGFTQYGFAFVASDADAADMGGDLAKARAGRERARRLFLRARDYGLRGLDRREKGMSGRLDPAKDYRGALKALTDAEEDVPFLYWTAASWSLAISNGKGDMALVAQLPVPIAMMERALELDEAWGEGALHEYFLALDPGRTTVEGGGVERAKQHYERALALSKNKKLGPHVSYAEGVLVKLQDREGFTKLLEQVLQADPEADKPHRLENVLAQRRARLLLDHADDLFL